MFNAANMSHVSVVINSAGTHHIFSMVQLARGQLVNDRKRKHHAGGWPTHILKVIFHSNIPGRNGSHANTEEGQFFIARMFGKSNGFFLGSALVANRNGNVITRLFTAHNLLGMAPTIDLFPSNTDDAVSRREGTVGRRTSNNLRNLHL